MRLPNGYGSVVKLSGNRRRPYMVRKTIGYDKNSRQIYSILGYYPTRDDALIALAHYNQEDVPVVGITLAKVFQAWDGDARCRFSVVSNSILNFGTCICLD